MSDLPGYDQWKLATPPRYEEEPECEWTAEDYAADEADRINDEPERDSELIHRS